MEEATCERIIKIVDSILKKDPHLDEFDIIYSSGETNKSPVIHVDHKLALESWCVKYVYKHAYSSALHYRSTGGYENSCALTRWTQLCLLVMPEVSTFWNIRKKMIKKNQLEVSADLQLCKLILSRKPKCIEAFQHRRWLFDCILSGTTQNIDQRNEIVINNNFHLSDHLREFLLNEFNLCTWTANRKQNNYHSWNHRLWVLNHLSQSWNTTETYKSEYDCSHEWISFHVSEHSGMHYHTKLLDRIVSGFEGGLFSLEFLDNDVNSVESLYRKELKMNGELIALYPGHESLFYMRRVFLLKLYSLLGNLEQRASPPPPAFKRSCIEVLNADWNIILQGEIELVNETKCLFQYHHLAEQHLNWVKNVIAY